MTTPWRRVAPVFAFLLISLEAQSPPGRPTDQARPDEIAKLKSGPALPYKPAANWPQMPKGYNFGEASGVDVDKQGNVWVFNRGHWPVMEFGRYGKASG